jgi:hypothetical protein
VAYFLYTALYSPYKDTTHRIHEPPESSMTCS